MKIRITFDPVSESQFADQAVDLLRRIDTGTPFRIRMQKDLCEGEVFKRIFLTWQMLSKHNAIPDGSPEEVPIHPPEETQENPSEGAQDPLEDVLSDSSEVCDLSGFVI